MQPVMTAEEQLEDVKLSMGISGDFNDFSILVYIREVREFMVDAGVSENVAGSTAAIGCIARGVLDLWNYGAGNTTFSQYFFQRLEQLRFKEV